MQRLELKPTHKPVQNYYAALRQFDDLGVTHETAVRSAFQGLLDHCARQHDWTLVLEWELRRNYQRFTKAFAVFAHFGTGSFEVHLMHEIPRSTLPLTFAHELHASEIMLLPR
jgi:hypothetical protein